MVLNMTIGIKAKHFNFIKIKQKIFILLTKDR